MKKEGHPKYHSIVATCACGAEVVTGSTEQKIHVDICSLCHPFFSGKQKLLDSEGVVDKFLKRQAKSVEMAKAKKK